jgi:SAM-dependent methyltransferase
MESFKDLERAGWNSKARGYDELTGTITAQAIDPLLESVGAKPGMRLLDVACGTGLLAAAAAERGLKVTGVDFARSMVAEAKRKHKNVEFHVGDAETLAFDNGTFDVVTCLFGLLHLADPDAAIAQAFRVLKPGGRFAFTVWCDPDKAKFFEIVLNAIKSHGTLDVPLPPAPPLFRFSDHEEARRSLEAQGFIDVRAADLPIVLATTSQGLLDFIRQGTVRMSMVLDRQSPAAKDAIHRAIIERAEPYRVGVGLRIPNPAVLASGVKPSI